MTVLGAVLAGGMSTRMGTDKADVLVRDKTMLERVGHAVQAVTDQTIVLGPDREGWETWPDSVHVHGPLAGIATALNRTGHGHVLLLAVDQPFVRIETLRRIVDLAADIPVVPVDEHGVPQVTCALYPRAIREEAFEEATANGSVQSLLDRVSFKPIPPDEWRNWGEDGRSWYSTDDPDALEQGLELYG
jgi:molybdopterin-guanine dinucleotide biosynthesis protein A